MKHKVLYILTAIGLLIAAFLLVQIDKSVVVERYHQHESWDVDTKTKTNFSNIETHLPVINIDTGGKKVPGASIKGLQHVYELSEDFKEYINANITVYEGNNDPINEQAHINYRGNSSRHFDKKSYSLRFVDEKEEDIEVAMLGMNADNNWSLNGPFLDRSLIRNYIAMNWAGEIMSFAPNVRFAEVFVDGHYEGLYLLMEKVSRAKGRINIETPKRGSDRTGYIVRYDRGDKIANKLDDFVMNTYKVYPSGTELRYPTEKNITEGRQQFIKQDYSSIAYSMYQMPYNISYPYGDVLNVEEFYDYFIISELFRLVDAGQYSTYFYRDLRGKLTPVVWDFNNSINNYQDSVYDESGFSLTKKIFYKELLKDEIFTIGLIRRYQELRESKLKTEQLHQYIDDTVSFLGEAIERNNERWDSMYDLSQYDSPNYLHPKDRNMKDYDEAVQQVKDYLEDRANWLDEHIDSLYQYSHPSRIGHNAVK